MIENRGSKLKLDLEQADEGIFLINTEDSSDTNIQHVHTNLPSMLSGMLSDNVISGSYTQARARLNGNKSLSIGVYTKELSVN